MNKRGYVTEEMHDEMINMYNNGHTYDDIASRFNTTKVTVSYHIKKARKNGVYVADRYHKGGILAGHMPVAPANLPSAKIEDDYNDEHEIASTMSLTKASFLGGRTGMEYEVDRIARIVKIFSGIDKDSYLTLNLDMIDAVIDELNFVMNRVN